MIRKFQATILFSLVAFFLITINSYSFDTSRPNPDDGPTEVKAIVYVLDVDDVIDADQSFKSNIFLSATWKDERLIVDNQATKYNLDKIWHPNLQILNRQKTATTLPQVAEVDENGTVIYRQRVVGNFSQPLNLRRFPLDKQKLSFQIVSVGSRNNSVKIIQGESGMAKKFSLPNWKPLSWEYEIRKFKFLPNVPEIEGLEFTIIIKRYVNYYIFKFVVPLLLIVLMSWIVFWIDPKDYTTQISVSITSMLTLITYQFLVGNSLPQVNYLTLLDKLMVFSTGMVFITLIEVIISSYLFKQEKLDQARTLDRYCRYVFPSVFIIFAVSQLIITQ